MRKRKIAFYLLSVLLLSIVSCIDKDDDACREEHGLSFYALDREGNNEFKDVIRSIRLSAYQQNVFITDWKLLAQPYLVPHLSAGTYTLTAFANLSDTLSYDVPLTEIRLKQDSTGFYRPGTDLFYGEKVFVSRSYGLQDMAENDSLFLHRAMGKVRVIINKIPLDGRNYTGQVVISGTAVGVDQFNHPLNVPVKVMQTGTIVNNKLLIDVVCFPSLETLKVETRLRNRMVSNQDVQLSRVLNELLSPNKLIILEYEYQPSNVIVELHITVVDWDDVTEKITEEAS